MIKSFLLVLVIGTETLITSALVVYFAAGNLWLNLMSPIGQIFCLDKHLREEKSPVCQNVSLIFKKITSSLKFIQTQTINAQTPLPKYDRTAKGGYF